MRGLWLTSHVLEDSEGAAAARAAAALGDDVHARLLEAGDRLAAISPLLAQRYYVRAAAAHRAFGPAGFERWLALGGDLASREPVSRDAALAFFAATPADFGAGGLATATAWARLARRVAAVSRRMASAFVEHSRPLLAGADAEARLAAWVEAGLALGEGTRGTTLAQAWFEASPALALALAPKHYPLLADLVRALTPAVAERALLGEPPAGLERCTPAERETLLRAARTLAPGGAIAAHAVWRALPAALARLAPDVRAAMVRVVAHLGPRAAAPLAETAPVVGALLAAVPAAERVPVLALVEEVAVRSPEATVAALRVLPRLFETARPDVVRAWFATGLRFAEERPDAAAAYFALESRTSVRALEASTAAATLEDARGVWTKLVQMVSGAPACATPSVRRFSGRFSCSRRRCACSTGWPPSTPGSRPTRAPSAHASSSASRASRAPRRASSSTRSWRTSSRTRRVPRRRAGSRRARRPRSRGSCGRSRSRRRRPRTRSASPRPSWARR